MITGNWSALELRHLAALMAVADEGSFAGAAERLGYTQAAVSQQVAALEKIVGARLIRRSAGRRPQGVTRPGKVVLNYAKTVLADIRLVQSELATVTTMQATVLRIGICASVSARVLPEVTSQLLSRRPEVTVELVDTLTDPELLDLVREGDLDVALVGLPAGDEPYDMVELLPDPYVLIVSAESALADTSGVTPETLAELPLISFRTCLEAGQLDRQLRARGVVPQHKLRTDSFQVLRDLVAAEVGYGLVPRLAVPQDDERLVAVPVDWLSPRRFGAVWGRGDTPGAALRSFLDIAEDYCAGLRLTDRLAE
jgi:LysR family hydrogen peroxide-inducible transcriptional activator